MNIYPDLRKKTFIFIFLLIDKLTIRILVLINTRILHHRMESSEVTKLFIDKPTIK